MSVVPHFPTIDGNFDIVFDVHKHNSLRLPGTPLNQEYGNAERLAVLGQTVLDLVVTSYLFARRSPLLSASEIELKRGELTSDANLELWMGGVAIQTAISIAPSEMNNINVQQEIRRFIHTYVGALYIRNGMDTVQRWITHLINPDADVTAISPVPPSTSPPPLPNSNTPPTRGDSGSGGLVTLALVNQTASQRGRAISYTAEQTGPPHLPTWTVRCHVDGKEEGCGVGRSQKVAKEAAARQAYEKLVA